MKRLAVIATVLAGRVASADPATAEAAYKQAEELRVQGKWADACPLYEASYHADAQLGVLLHLADCHEHAGRTATAWAEFTDAIDLARSKSDKREAYARSRADALVAKLAKLHLAPPKKLIPGLSVRRDGVDITVLVGTDIPIDPGEHELVAAAPGYVDWTTKVTIAGPGLTALDVPVLEKVVEKPVEPTKPVVHEGTLKITTLPTAEILLDSERVGTGSYEHKVKSGGHTLRIVAGGMRPYQSEIVVGDDETRRIDVPLEKEPAAAVVMVAPAAKSDGSPSYETGVGFGTGVKMHGDRPLVSTVRAEIAFRFAHRVNFGFFAEYGTIDRSGACGFDMPGPMPTTPYDFGLRDQFTSCSYVMPGLQLYVHVLPRSRIDPYIGVSPGFRFGFTEWTPYVAGIPQAPHSEVFPAIVAPARVGVDYHPRPDYMAWQVGAFFETVVTVFGKETSDSFNGNGGVGYISLFGGLRTGIVW